MKKGTKKNRLKLRQNIRKKFATSTTNKKIKMTHLK